MTTVENKKISGELRAKRLAMGLTTLQLAQKAKVSLMVIRTAEKTDKLFDTLAGRRLARRLKVPVSELVPLTRKHGKRVAEAVVVRPVDVSRGVPAIGEPKGLPVVMKPIPTAVVAVGSLFGRAS